MTAVFNSDASPEMETIQNKVNTLVSDRKGRAEMAEAPAEPPEDEQ
jgi:hypothetical protein